MRCDHGHDTENGVRILPIDGGYRLICHEHYLKEIACRPDLPNWDDLKQYEETLLAEPIPEGLFDADEDEPETRSGGQ